MLGGSHNARLVRARCAASLLSLKPATWTSGTTPETGGHAGGWGGDAAQITSKPPAFTRIAAQSAERSRCNFVLPLDSISRSKAPDRLVAPHLLLDQGTHETEGSSCVPSRNKMSECEEAPLLLAGSRNTMPSQLQGKRPLRKRRIRASPSSDTRRACNVGWPDERDVAHGIESVSSPNGRTISRLTSFNPPGNVFSVASHLRGSWLPSRCMAANSVSATEKQAV